MQEQQIGKPQGTEPHHPGEGAGIADRSLFSNIVQFGSAAEFGILYERIPQALSLLELDVNQITHGLGRMVAGCSVSPHLDELYGIGAMNDMLRRRIQSTEEAPLYDFPDLQKMSQLFYEVLSVLEKTVKREGQDSSTYVPSTFESIQLSLWLPETLHFWCRYSPRFGLSLLSKLKDHTYLKIDTEKSKNLAQVIDKLSRYTQSLVNETLSIEHFPTYHDLELVLSATNAVQEVPVPTVSENPNGFNFSCRSIEVDFDRNNILTLPLAYRILIKWLVRSSRAADIHFRPFGLTNIDPKNPAHIDLVPFIIEMARADMAAFIGEYEKPDSLVREADTIVGATNPRMATFAESALGLVRVSQKTARVIFSLVNSRQKNVVDRQQVVIIHGRIEKIQKLFAYRTYPLIYLVSHHLVAGDGESVKDLKPDREKLAQVIRRLHIDNPSERLPVPAIVESRMRGVDPNKIEKKLDKLINQFPISGNQKEAHLMCLAYVAAVQILFPEQKVSAQDIINEIDPRRRLK